MNSSLLNNQEYTNFWSFDDNQADFSNESSYDCYNNWTHEDSYSLNNLSRCLNSDRIQAPLEEASKTVNEKVEIIVLEEQVKEEINLKGIDFALTLCLKSKNSDKKKINKKLRNKQTKTKEQIERLEHELKADPNIWSKQKRLEIAKEIGLSQIQVYKWFYDNTSGKDVERSSDVTISSESHKRVKTQE